MGMTCDNCGKDAGNLEIWCEKCVAELQGDVKRWETNYDSLRDDYEQLKKDFKELEEAYNAPIMKFAREEYKDGPKTNT
mgnify:CR=1 FL=1